MHNMQNQFLHINMINFILFDSRAMQRCSETFHAVLHNLCQYVFILSYSNVVAWLLRL